MATGPGLPCWTRATDGTAVRARAGSAPAATYDRGVSDLRLVREHPETVRASQRARGADESLVDDLLAADAARREAVGHADSLRAEQKAASQAVKEATPEERPAVLERAKAL